MDKKAKINALPNSPGVYMMKNASGEVLYVGKAINLRKRVSSYFRPNGRLSERIRSLVSQVEDIAHIDASTEAEALIYENSLIKKFSPKYNVALKDGKSYPMLKLTTNEKFARLFITRQKKDDGAVYFGPYTSGKLLRSVVTILKRIFPLRTCAKMPKGVCLNFHIKQCLGPCESKVSEKDYASVVAELKMFLEGRKGELTDLLAKKMAEASARSDYEEAARIRDRIEALSSINSRRVSYGARNELEELQNVLELPGKIDVIEAFDISNIMGEEAVGSMIYFYKGRPRKSEYRKFRIRSVSGIDDYSMMRELVMRRYRRLVEEKKALPDLIVIDGGKGHLNIALDELKKLGLENIPAIGIAKEFEHIFMKGKGDPIILPKGSKALHLLERVRDEAHRFAITYHKSLLSKKIGESELDYITAIGSKRKRSLLMYFGSIEGVKKASLEELMKVGGMNAVSAKNIIAHFKE
ncbi:MAG: excinuclease ABC subunit UvrC [Candidatus Omnitrophota bacterium]|jgi:excinuclease ABC subunit C